MHPFDDDYLSQMSPESERQQPAEEEELSQPSGCELFDAIAAYISRYLSCDQHQLTILTLWVVHTWFFRDFDITTYLNITSPEPQSGKSICLMLLRQLSKNPSYSTGASPGSLMKYLLAEPHKADNRKFDSTLFLDDCQYTFGSSERQPLVSLLKSSADISPCYLAAPHEYYFFGPKAFAGNAPLPRSLADRCIPISLRRKRPSEGLARFNLKSTFPAAAKLVSELTPWIARTRQELENSPQNTALSMPPGLTPRQQACAEPLLDLANLIGAPWPEKARAAIAGIFNLARGTEAVELLCDMRALFYSRSDPEYLATTLILSAIRELEHRPWGSWSPKAWKKLGALLYPLGIKSRFVHDSPTSGFRAYFFKDFQDAWERYMPPISSDIDTKHLADRDPDASIVNNSKKLIRRSESGPISANVHF